MSVELPESKILAEQMNQKLRGKQVTTFQVKDCERLQKIGMMEKDLTVFNQLVNAKIETIVSRGNVLRIKFDNGINLILGPEYGGEIFYHTSAADIPRFHLRLDFSDGTVLTVRLTSMGVIQVRKDDELDSSYVYKRDFDFTKLSATEEEFTFEQFSKRMADKNKMLKAVLVGKDAILVGISNSTFQDILYRARIHPKRRASELSKEEMRSLYDAIQFVFKERIRLNGKDIFRDLYGKQGGYTPAMGPNMKEQNCPECGTAIQKLSHGGGHVYLCPNCQK
ncbi:MAG TPA: DNA-formamidopyrimidine glycosylase family protein [Acidobacteriota bacterium]|nr:DNA-formamidopyrimidine glycosylase family protein [Acidobacteriota bacterium]